MDNELYSTFISTTQDHRGTQTVLSVVHEGIVNGNTFKDKKNCTKFRTKSNGRSELSHTRIIRNNGQNERNYTVVLAAFDKKKLDKRIETNMDEDQINSFRREWNANWKPSLGQPSNRFYSIFLKVIDVLHVIHHVTQLQKY